MIPYPNSNSIGSTCNRETTFSGLRISSASVSSSETSSSMLSMPAVCCIFLPTTIYIAPNGTNRIGFKGVTIPKKIRVAPTIYNTFGIPKSCLISTSPKSASFDALVTKIPVEREMTREGIWLTKPSPMVRSPYCWIASANGSP